MVVEVNVERCEVVTVNICYFTACFSVDGKRGEGLLLSLYSRTFLKKF